MRRSGPELSGHRARLFGPRVVRVEVRIARPADAVAAQVAEWLGSQLFGIVDRVGSSQIWVPRRDLRSRLRRRVGARRGGRVRIGAADAVASTVIGSADPGGATTVRLEARFDDLRRGLLGGAVAVPALAAAGLGGVVAVATSNSAFLVFGGLVAGVFALLGLVGTRRTLVLARADARQAFTDALAGLGGQIDGEGG